MPSEMYFTEHHESHAASAFYPSPFESAAVLTMDGGGVWATASIGHRRMAIAWRSILREMRFPHSVGLLYSAFTYFCGFRCQLRRIQAHGTRTLRGADLCGPDHPTTLSTFTTGRLDRTHISSTLTLLGGLTMRANERFAELFGGPARSPEGAITREGKWTSPAPSRR